MATFQKNCDIKQGYDFKKDIQRTVGYITSLKVGDTELKADQTVKDPTSPETDYPVVAVLSGAGWHLGPTDTIYFTGQISVANKQQVALLVYKDLSKVDVEFKFAVYEYDPLEKKYFQCMLPTEDSALKGLLEKEGGDLSIGVADDPSPEPQMPQNHSFHIGIKPQTEAEQKVTLAASYSEKVVKAWGMKVG